MVAYGGGATGECRRFAAPRLNALIGCIKGDAGLGSKAKVMSRGDGILVRRQKAELPTVLCGLVLDPVLDVLAREGARGVLESVREDGEDHAAGYHLSRSVVEDMIFDTCLEAKIHNLEDVNRFLIAYECRPFVPQE